MVPFLKYTVLRLGLFVVCLVLLRLAGAGGLLLLVLAAGVSMALSFLLLRRPREELAAVVHTRVQRRVAQRQPPGADEDYEDRADDERRTGPHR